MVETYPGGQLTSRTCINTYDAANRLTKESITTGAVLVTTDYTYDDAHNRTLKKVTDDGVITQNITYNYGTNNKNQIESYNDSIAVTTTNLTYDDNGNRISKSNASGPDTLYYYDRENRLIELVTDTEHDINIYAGENSSGTPLAIANYSTSGTQSRYLYAYDYRTRRVLRDESGAGGEKTYIVFSGGTSIQEYEEDTTADIPGFDSSDDLLAEYIRGSDYGGGVGGILYSLRSSVPSYYHYNGRGDVTAKTDSASAITYQAAYEAFGKHGDTASSESWGTNVDRQQANTKDEDPTGLLNEGFRYRDLTTGTFITRDPLGFVDGPNVYTYVMQNPWTYFDPLGLQESEDYINNLDDYFDYGNGKTTTDSLLNLHGLETGNVGLGDNVNAINGLEDHTVSGLLETLGSTPFEAGGQGMFGGELTPEQSAGHNRNRLNMLAFRGSSNGQYLGAYTAGMSVLTETYGETATAFGVGGLTKAAISPLLRTATSSIDNFAGIADNIAVKNAPVSNGSSYSVAFETTLDSSIFGRSRSVHFNRANAALDTALNADPSFAKNMDNLIPGVAGDVSTTGGRRTPSDWTWHHGMGEGVMQLTPSSQHMPGSLFQNAFHPDGRGGYSIWAIPNGAPPN